MWSMRHANPRERADGDVAILPIDSVSFAHVLPTPTTPFPSSLHTQGGDSMPEVDVLLKGLLNQPGVEGFMVFNDDGASTRTRLLWCTRPTRNATADAMPRATPLCWCIPLTYSPSPVPRLAGIPLKWTSNGFIKPGTPNSANPIPPQIIHNTALISDLAEKAKATARKLLGEVDGDLQVLRLHTKTTEMVIAPAAESTRVVVQRANSAAMVSLVAQAEAAQVTQMAEEKKGGDKK